MSTRNTPLLVVGIASLICVQWCATRAHAADKPASNVTTSEAAAMQRFLRVSENGAKTAVSLDIALREYTRPDGRKVGLVAVAHIAEQSFYNHMQDALKAYDVVLFESVSPPGTRRVGFSDDASRAAWSRRGLEFLASLGMAYLSTNRQYPPCLPELREFAVSLDPRMTSWIDVASVDAWNNPVQYEFVDLEIGFVLSSFGADGKLGGEGGAADILVRSSDLPATAPSALAGEKNLQAELADVLGLAFQLEAIDYGKPNWRCSDMSIDQVQTAFAARGLDFSLIGDTLGGSSLPAIMIKTMLQMIKLLDSIMENRIADMVKIMLIEMLGDEQIMEGSFKQMGQGLQEVLIDERNQVVIDDLKHVLEHEPQINSIAILYGAGHMQDMVDRLRDQLQFMPDAEENARWYRAVSVDLNKSAISKRELSQMRLTFRRMLKQATSR